VGLVSGDEAPISFRKCDTVFDSVCVLSAFMAEPERSQRRMQASRFYDCDFDFGGLIARNTATQADGFDQSARVG
jgi:hypothetical protein